MSKFFEATSKMDPSLTDAAPEAPLTQTPASQADAASQGTKLSASRPITSPIPYVVPSSSARSGVVGATPPLEGCELYPPLEGIPKVSVKLTAGLPILPFDGSDEKAAERYRSIRTKLRQDARRPRVLCVSSSGMGDGKSVNAINMAGVLALKQDNRVLLVDSDFRRSTLAAMLGLPKTPGLSEVLAGTVKWQQAVTRIADAPNLYFMPAGEQEDNPAELLDSARWKTTCDAFRHNFNFVVIDSPPMGTVTDYDLIQSVCDGVILVARQDYSNRVRLLKCIDLVPVDKLIGVLMNCVSPWILWKAADDAGDPYGYKPASK